jgi:hypothetical protein
LRQLVDAGASQPPSDSGNLLVAHAAKFENREWLTLTADSGLEEQGWAAVFEPRSQSHSRRRRRKNSAGCTCRKDVQRPLAAIWRLPCMCLYLIIHD